MARQIENAYSEFAAHEARRQRAKAFHAPQKMVKSDQDIVGSSSGFPTVAKDGHRMGPSSGLAVDSSSKHEPLPGKTQDGHAFGPGKDGGDSSKLS